jgi:hypothetical protein
VLEDFLLQEMRAEDQAEVIQTIRDASGELAPFDPYLHWSLNRREYFVSRDQADTVALLKAGLFVVRYHGALFLARQFLNTNGWLWACVPLQNAQADDRMLLSMMEGVA